MVGAWQGFGPVNGFHGGGLKWSPAGLGYAPCCRGVRRGHGGAQGALVGSILAWPAFRGSRMQGCSLCSF